MSQARKRVVIIGGGFGGLYAAKGLGHQPVDVVLVDRKNHHTFQPLLYQVASAALSPGDIASPIRGILSRYKNIEVLLDEAVGFDLPARKVHLRDGADFGYDYLIVAAGATHSYFGHDAWKVFAPGLKTVEDATEIRRRILLAFENAERTAAEGRDPGPLNFVVVGAGPTGVEMAGALIEIARGVLLHDFRHIDPANAHVILIEGAPRVLASYPEDLSHSAAEQLRRMGVELRTGVMVTSVEPGQVRVGDTVIASSVTLWAAGVSASPVGKMLSQNTDRAGRVPVGPDLSMPGHPEVFVIGDLAEATGKDGKPLPGLAAVALQEGKATAANISRDLKGEVRKPFHYRDRGVLATIGRQAAVAKFGRIHMTGFTAWVAWLFIHLLLLIGFRNRVLVLINWAWAYFAYQRGARLITDVEAIQQRGALPQAALDPAPTAGDAVRAAGVKKAG
ncbi:MAG: NAD(P)/FAD-dependent oxidoreductase [Acidobacteriaceae bacterium]|nr:NAD(P)/FAD-dependent oxidoreductase [Acidobacteriaceae bacterium]